MNGRNNATSDDTFYIIGGSTDYGNTIQLNTPQSTTKINSGHFYGVFGVAIDPTTDPSANKYYAAISSTNIYYNSVDGNTWTPITTNIGTSGVYYGYHCGSPNLDMSLLAGGVYTGGTWYQQFTKDKGANWTKLSTTSINTNSDGGLFSSGDGSLILFGANGSSSYGTYYCKWSNT